MRFIFFLLFGCLPCGFGNSFKLKKGGQKLFSAQPSFPSLFSCYLKLFTSSLQRRHIQKNLLFLALQLLELAPLFSIDYVSGARIYCTGLCQEGDLIDLPNEGVIKGTVLAVNFLYTKIHVSDKRKVLFIPNHRLTSATVSLDK